MSLDPVKNFAKVTVSGGYDSDDTEITLVSGEGSKLPNPSTDGEFNLIWWDATNFQDPSDDPNVEIVRCTARSTDVLTVTRAQEGTSASNKNTSGSTYKMVLALTKKTMDDINNLVTLNKDITITYSGDFVSTITINSRQITFTNDGEKYTEWEDANYIWTPTYDSEGRIVEIEVTAK